MYFFTGVLSRGYAAPKLCKFQPVLAKPVLSERREAPERSRGERVEGTCRRERASSRSFGTSGRVEGRKKIFISCLSATCIAPKWCNPPPAFLLSDSKSQISTSLRPLFDLRAWLAPSQHAPQASGSLCRTNKEQPRVAPRIPTIRDGGGRHPALSPSEIRR